MHLVSEDGNWMLWPENARNDDSEVKQYSQGWCETHIRGNFHGYKEYRVGAIFCEGQLGELIFNMLL